MNILCSPINQKTRELARQADMSETFVQNIICAWQAENNDPNGYPSLEYIKSRNRNSNPEIYYATPVYSPKQYDSNEPLIKRNADNSISLLTLNPNGLKAGINLDKKQEYLNRFFELYKHIPELKEVVGNSLEYAYRFMLWTELAKVQQADYKVSDTSSASDNTASINRLAEINALNKLKDYAGEHKQPKRTLNVWAGTHENEDLSNIAKRPFTLQLFAGENPVRFHSVEHAFQYTKFRLLAQYLGFEDTKPFLLSDQKLTGEDFKGNTAHWVGRGVKAQSLLQNNQGGPRLGDYQEELDLINKQIEKILNSTDGWDAKRLGGKRGGYNISGNSGSTFLNTIWDYGEVVSEDVMEAAIKASFEQNPDAAQRLIDTGNVEITHNQAGDNDKWKTEFPRILMEVRSELQNSNQIKTNDAPTVKTVPLRDLKGKLASTDVNNVISIADNFTLEEFFDYITGKGESPTSQQKQEVFRRMGTYGYPIELLKAVIKTVDDAKKFLQYHEESHVVNRDREAYWSEEEKTSSKRDYMAENKLAIETRATLDAIKKFLTEKGYKKEQISTGLDLGRYISWQNQHITKSPNFARDHKYLYDSNPISYSITELRDKLWPKNIQGDHSYAAALGNSVDAIVRDYFDSSKDPKTIKYPNISDFRKESLLKDCARIEQWIHKKWGKNSIIITSEFALAGKTKFNDKEVSVAGTMDMLVIGEDGKLHILDMKAKKDATIDMFDNRRDYTYQLNGYRQIIDLIPGLDGKVEDLHLLWFDHTYPKSGSEATYITQDDGTVLISTQDVNKAPIEYFNGWTTPSLREKDEDAFVNIGLDSPLIDTTLLEQIPEVPAAPVPVATPVVKPPVKTPKRKVSDAVPKIGREGFDIKEDSDRTKLIKSFTAQQRKYRVEMMAKDFSRHLAKLVKKEQQDITKRIDELKKNDGSAFEIAELEEQKEALFDDKKAKKEVISKYGVPMILESMKDNYRQMAEMPAEQAAQYFGERAEYIQGQYRNVLDCFMPLMQEVAPMLERNGEPIRFVFSKQTYYTGNGTTTVDGGHIENTTADQDNEEREFSDDTDGKRATGNDGWAFEAKFTEPHLTLTQAVKQLLGDLKRTDTKGKVEYDDLGNIRYVPERFAYASLLAELSQIIDADDFCVKDENGNYSFPALERLQYIPQYSWVQQIIKKFRRNPSLASQFFRNFRKDAVIYRTQKWDKEAGIWKTIALNELTAEDAAMNALKRNWNNMIPQHPDSVFTNTGAIVKDNAIKGIELADSLMRDLPFIELDTEAGLAELAERVGTLTRMLGFRPDSISIEKLLGENALANINTTVGIIKNIFNGIRGDIPENVDIVDYFSTGDNYGMRGFTGIAERIGVVSETDHIQIFRLNDKDRPTYGAPDYSTKIVKSIKRDDKRYPLLERFKQDPFYYNSKTGQWRNEFFRLLEDESEVGREVRAALTTLDMPAIGEGPKAPYNKWSPFDIKTAFIRQYFFSPVSAKAPIQFGWYNFPIFSDTEMARFIRLPRYIGNFKEQMIPMFRDLVKQELVRINRVNERRELIKQGKVQKIPNYDDNGHKFFFLPSLNDLGNNFKETAIALINAGNVEALNSYIDNVLSNEDNSGILDVEFQEFLDGITDTERAALIRDLTHEGAIKTADDLNGALEEYFWNHHLATANIIQLFTTDLAYYKDDNGVDFQKRWKEVFAGGEKLNINSKYGKRLERSIILKDQEIVSNAYQHIKIALNEAVKDNRLLSMDRDNILYKFRNVNATDGQGFRSLKSFRSVLDMMGIWDEKMETAFNHFRDGVWTMEDFNLIWQTIKPYLFSNYLVPDGLGGMMNKPEQHKDSEFLLLSMYQLVAAGTKQATKLKALNEWMDSNDIDVVLFESAVKVGNQGAIDINYSQDRLSKWVKANQSEWDKIRKEAVNGYLAFNNITPTTKSIADAENKVAEMSDMKVFRLGNDYMLDSNMITQDTYESRFAAIEPNEDEIKNILSNDSGINKGNKRGNPEVVHEIPYEDYCVQQPTPEHLFDVVDAVFGSQFRVLITSDLPENFELQFNGETLTKQQVIDLWQHTITENLLDAYEKISGKFESIESLSAYLQQQVTNNSRYGRDLLDALEVVEVTDPVSKETKKVFNVPFNCPTVRAKIQELVLSAFKNQITKQTIHGGNAILVSNWGLTKELHVLHGEDGAVTGIECYLPAYSKSFYEAFMVTKTGPDGKTYQELDINKVPKNLLKGIGYRIPTEGKYSMVPIIIKGFLPQQNGSSIMLPADITTLSGSDFDIDKLFLMLPNFDVIRYNMKAAREDYAKEDALFKEVLPQIFSSPGAEDFTQYDSDSFKNWFARNKERYKYEKPIIKKVRYDKKKGITGNTKRQRDNLLIDLAFAILTHKDTAKKLQNPGNFDKVKIVARINTLSSDPNSILMFARERFGDLAEDATPEDIARELIELGRKEGFKPLHEIAKKSAKRRNVLSLDTFVFNHQQNMAGASLIGMYANNDTSQAKHQSVPMSMRTEGIMVNGKRIKSLTAFEVFDGKTFHLISKNCAEMLAAAVDNGKDPNLAALLQNDDTANILGTMLRAGLSIEEAGLLFNHPLIKKILLAGNTNAKDFIEALEDVKSMWQQTTGAPLPEADAMVAYNFTSEEILTQTIKDLLRPDTNNMSGEELAKTKDQYTKDLADQIRVATLFSKFVEVADLFGELTQCTRADSPNGALAVTLAEANIQRRKLTLLHRKARKADCPIVGLDDFIKNSYLSINDSKDSMRESLYRSRQPMLQAFYSLGIDLAQDLIAKHFVEYEPFIEERVNRLHDNSATGILPKKSLNAFYLDTFKYYMSAAFAEDADSYEERRNYYLNKFPDEFLRVIRQNPDLANIGIVRKLLYEKKSILLDKSSKIDSPTVEVLTRDFDLLMYDSDNPVAQQLAMDLFCYCYFKNGLEFGPNNFGRFFSSNFIASIPRFINRLREMQGSNESDDFWDNMLDQYYMYHGMDFAVTPKVKGTNYDAPAGEGRSIHISKVRNPNVEDERPFEYIRYMEEVGEGPEKKMKATLMKLVDRNKTEGHITYAPVKTVYVKDGKRYNPFMTADEIADLYAEEKRERDERNEALRQFSAQLSKEDIDAETARAANSRPVIPDHIAQDNPTENISEGATNLVDLDGAENLPPMEMLDPEGNSIDDWSDEMYAQFLEAANREEIANGAENNVDTAVGNALNLYNESDKEIPEDLCK